MDPNEALAAQLDRLARRLRGLVVEADPAELEALSLAMTSARRGLAEARHRVNVERWHMRWRR